MAPKILGCSAEWDVKLLFKRFTIIVLNISYLFNISTNNCYYQKWNRKGLITGRKYFNPK